MAFVYILKLANEQYYVGSTYNLPHRMRQHNRGEDLFTKKFLPVELKYFEEYESKEEAARRERQIKGWSRAKKEKLISGEWGIHHCVYPELVEGFAESATAELHKEKNPHGYNASAQLAKAGGKAAEAARLNLEEQLGHSIISREKATDYLPPADRWDSLPEEKDDDENE